MEPPFSQLEAAAQRLTSEVESRNQGGYKLRSGRCIRYDSPVMSRQVSPSPFRSQTVVQSRSGRGSPKFLDTYVRHFPNPPYSISTSATGYDVK